MASGQKGTKKSVPKPSVWKNRKKPFLIIEIFLALIATVLAVVNIVLWNVDLPFVSFLIMFLVGTVFVVRGVESRFNQEKEYKMTLGFGILICILAMIPYVKYL